MSDANKKTETVDAQYSEVAGALAARMMEESLRNGNQISIPSLGIIIKPRKTKKKD